MGIFRSVVNWAAVVAVILSGFAAIAVAGLLGGSWIGYGRHVANLKVGAFTVANGVRPHGLESLGVGESCPDERPVKIGIRNDSSRTLVAASLKVQAFMPGQSANVLHSSAVAKSDAILRPGEMSEGCWSFPLPGPKQDYAAAHYVVTVQKASFQ